VAFFPINTSDYRKGKDRGDGRSANQWQQKFRKTKVKKKRTNDETATA